mgnify:CR=1 FL=1
MKKVVKFDNEFRFIEENEIKTNIYSSSSKLDCKRIRLLSKEEKPNDLKPS